MTPKTITVFFLAAVLLVISGDSALFAGGAARLIEDTRLMMGTEVRIQIPVSGAQDELSARQAMDKAFEEISRLEALLSVYSKESEVSRINARKAGEAVKVSGEVFGLIERSIDCSMKTNGAFDITVKPLVDLWGEAGKMEKLPSRASIELALKKVGFRHLLLDKDNSTITFEVDGMALDLGGIAKGYATGRAVAVLKANGIKAALAGSGGDIYCLGMRSENEMWKVGIQHPRDDKKLFAALRLKNQAIDTSGDYEKFFMLGGKKYSHIIDPRTGWPVDNGVVSVTVVSDDPVAADAFATALCVSGADALTVADSLALDTLVIRQENGSLKVGMSGGFKEQYGKAKK
ncbi:MAG: FAD:protein FMN transferase [Candidatus Omnitrophota bacterium]